MPGRREGRPAADRFSVPLALVGAALLGVLALAGVGAAVSGSRSAVGEQFNEQQLLFARGLAGTMARMLRAYGEIASTLPPPRDGEAWLRELAARHELFAKARLSLHAGDGTALGALGHTAADVLGHHHPAPPSKAEVVVCPRCIEERKALVLSLPLVGTGAFLEVHIPLKDLWRDHFAGLDVPTGHRVFLLDGSGRMLAGPSGAPVGAPLHEGIASDPGLANLHRGIARGLAGTARARIGAPGESALQLCAYAPVPDAEGLLSVLVATDETEVTARLARIQNAGLASAAAMVLAVLLGSIVAFRERRRRWDLERRSIEERVEMERRQIHQDRLALLGTLAAAFAHEIKSPVTALLGNLDFALRVAPTDLREPIEDASRAAQRLAQLARDYTGFSRLSHGGDRADLRAVLEGSVRLAGPELRRHEVADEVGELPPVAGAPGLLTQVFVNLLVNAAQAIDGRGRITLRAERSDGAVLVRVGDNGRGIPEETRKRLFTPFFTTKPEGVGTGLGLAISRRIVEAAGGSIEVESAAGAGTTFTVRLPIAAGDAPPAL